MTTSKPAIEERQVGEMTVLDLGGVSYIDSSGVGLRRREFWRCYHHQEYVFPHQTGRATVRTIDHTKRLQPPATQSAQPNTKRLILTAHGVSDTPRRATQTINESHAATKMTIWISISGSGIQDFYENSRPEHGSTRK